MTACRKQGWRISFILWSYYFCFSVGEILWILNRRKTKHPLCKKGDGWILWAPVSIRQDLSWVVLEISEHCALPSLTHARKLVQKPPSATRRAWEAPEQCLRAEKGPLLRASHFSAGWCLPTKPIFSCGLSPEHRLGDAHGSRPPSNHCSASPLNWLWSPVKSLQK